MAEKSRAESEKSIQDRAVAYGAQDVEPTQISENRLEWPADEERVGLVKICYDKKSDTFQGWSVGANVPEWDQK